MCPNCTLPQMVTWKHTTMFSNHDNKFVLALQGDSDKMHIKMESNVSAQVVVKYLNDPEPDIYRFKEPFSLHENQLHFFPDFVLQQSRMATLSNNSSTVAWAKKYKDWKHLEKTVDWCASLDGYTQHSYYVLTSHKNYHFMKYFDDVISHQVENRIKTESTVYLTNLCLKKPHYPMTFSWNTASQFCKQCGNSRQLPEFFSRNEQDELITVLKMKAIFPMESLFIGLKNVDHLKVQVVLYIPLFLHLWFVL